jgi:hypothetical protein
LENYYDNIQDIASGKASVRKFKFNSMIKYSRAQLCFTCLW